MFYLLCVGSFSADEIVLSLVHFETKWPGTFISSNIFIPLHSLSAGKRIKARKRFDIKVMNRPKSVVL